MAAKENKFAQYQIEMAFSGSLVRIKDMEPVDICILFSNLIDNAIEELIKVEGERYFHIVVHESPAMIMISFKNSTTGNFFMVKVWCFEKLCVTVCFEDFSQFMAEDAKDLRGFFIGIDYCAYEQMYAVLHDSYDRCKHYGD